MSTHIKKEGLTIRHILILFSSCIFAGTAVGITGNCMGQFVTPLSNALKQPVGTVTIFITLTFLSSAFLGPIIVKVMNKGYMKLIMSMGIIVNAGCFYWFAAIKNIYMLYVAAIILGMANICFNLVPVTVILNNWFYKKIGLFTGICASFSGVVGAVFNPIVANWVTTLGYQKTFIICGSLVLALSLPCSVFFVHYHPENVGVLPYGYHELKEQNCDDQESRRQLPVYILILIAIYSIIQNSVSGMNPSISAMAKSIPLEASLPGTMVSAAMMGNVISKLSLGVLSDKFGAKKGISTMMILGAIGLILLSVLNPGSYQIALFGSLIYGCAFSCMANGVALLMREIYGPVQFSKYYPTISLFSNVAYAVSVTIVGKTFDWFGTYSVIEIGLAIVSICSIVLLFIIYVILNKMQQKCY